MAVTWKYCVLILSVFCLVIPVTTGQDEVTPESTTTTTTGNPETTQAADDSVNSTISASTTQPPSLPLLPTTEGQPDFYSFRKKHNKLIPCSRSTFLGSLATNYLNKDRYVVSTDIEIPIDVTFEGSCGEQTSTLALHWGGSNFSAHYLNFTFVTQPPSNGSHFSTWVLQSLSLSCNMDSDAFEEPLQGGMRTIESDPATTFFETPLGLAFACSSEQTIDLNHTDNTSEVLQSATLTLTTLEFQPFQLDASGEFAEAGTCVADVENTDELIGSSHTAAIAIASILCIVIVGTLVTYYCVRRGRKQRYTSME